MPNKTRTIEDVPAAIQVLFERACKFKGLPYAVEWAGTKEGAIFKRDKLAAQLRPLATAAKMQTRCKIRYDYNLLSYEISFSVNIRTIDLITGALDKTTYTR